MVLKLRKAKPKAKQEKETKNKISKYIKKQPKSVKTKRDNTYVFEGFYEKLKMIDVKHSHSLDANFIYDKLVEEQDFINDEDEQIIFRSNFIQLLRSEKANNKTLEFNKVYQELEKYSFSFPLLIHNKKKIIESLLVYLKQDDVLKVIQGSVIDLFIALIKDFRSDIYLEFRDLILVEVISIIDMQNSMLLDKIFTLISFAIKYLTKSIKDDLKAFYPLYFELLTHKNRFIRKFAAQSFCYVIRKLNFDENLFKLLVLPINDNQPGSFQYSQVNKFEDLLKIETHHELERIIGVSELLFETMYGAGETLHSKAQEILEQILNNFDKQQKSMIIMIRCVLLKLVNEVDTEKQQTIYKTIVNKMNYLESEQNLNIILLVFKDCIKLKYGKRLNSFGIIQIVECFNTLLQKNLSKTQKLSKMTHINIVDTLATLYYYKHQQVLNLYVKSNIDFATSKNIFNHYVYQVSNSIEIISIYFQLFRQENSEIKAESDLEWGKILGLKSNATNQMEFSKESHRQKLKLLIKSLNKFVLKQILDNNDPYQFMALFEILISQIDENFVIQITKVIEQNLLQSKNLGFLEFFILNKYISLCSSNENILLKMLQKSQSEKLQHPKRILSLNCDYKSNLVLKNYNEEVFNESNFELLTTTILDLDNIGDQKNIANQIFALEQIFIHRCQKESSVDLFIKRLTELPTDIVTLRAFNTCDIKPLSVKENFDLFQKLSANLLKNQRQIRLETIKILVNKFQTLDQKYEQNDNVEQDESMIEKCQVLNLVLEFEKLDIAFETEKAKILQIEKIKSQLSADTVPDEYLEVCFNFLIGCFWIKFTPVFKQVQETLQVLIRDHQDKFGLQILSLIQNCGYLTQLAHNNDELLSLLLNKRDIVQNENTLIKQAFLKETKFNDDFMEIKDFLYNLTKSISPQVIIDNKQLTEKAFDIYYQFIDYEYSILYFSKKQKNTSNLLDRMTFANMVESEEYRGFKRMAYSKNYYFLELFSRADSLRKISNVNKFQQLMLRFLNTSDTKLQKLALDCLLKSDQTGVLRQYRKLLEGFNDDQKFKDMIQVLIFGSQNQKDSNSYYQNEDDNKKSDKGSIPKLQEQHRMEVLPIVIKLLLSKLIKKKGAINKKTIHTRRHIVFQFMSSLNPDTELQLFFNELLSDFDIKIQDDSQFKSKELLQNHIAKVSFNGYLNFINSLSMIIKQMGTLLTNNNYLEKISQFFVQVLALSKIFIKQLKLTLVENKESSIFEQQNNDQVEQKDSIYKFVGQQSKDCMRKGLAIVKQIYSKYNNNQEFIDEFSRQIYDEIIKDQLNLLSLNYIVDKSQFMEIITVSWASSIQNYIKYKDVFPSLMGMLSSQKINPEVYELHFSLLKSLILKSIQGIEDKKDLAFLYKKSHKYEEDEDDDMIDKEAQEQERFKKALLKKQKDGPKYKHVQQVKTKTHEIKNQSVKDLIFIMSEVANYLKQGDLLNQNFLEMMVSIISMKSLHSETTYSNYNEELLYFGSKSVCNLLEKVPTVSQELVDKIYQIFLTLKSIRIRNSLSQGLASSLVKIQSKDNLLSEQTLEIVCNINKIKRGIADMELDYDLIIQTIQKLTENENIFQKQNFSSLELQVITYSILYLLQCEEYSVRDFASHFIKQLFGMMGNEKEQGVYLQLVKVIEETLVSQVKKIKDELILKTILDTLRYLINYYKQNDSSSQLKNLSPLVNLKDDNEDFFVLFLSIKMKSRQRSLKILSQQFQQMQINYKTIQAVILPLINYVVFGVIAQKNNRRNTITYSRDEKRITIEEGLNVYKSIAQQLKWGDYYKMIKTLLFKLQKFQQKLTLPNQEEDFGDLEKIIIKCLCKVLDGFHFEEVPDALLIIQNEIQEQKADENQNAADFDEVMKDVMNEKGEEEAVSEIEQEEKSEEDDQNDLEKDVEMDEENKEKRQSLKQDIQNKLFNKVLPILYRHLADQKQQQTQTQQEQSESSPRIRQFVALSIIKLLRRLQPYQFKSSLSKLITTLVSKGLRQKDIGAREKGRKAIVKVLEEIGPKFLESIMVELQDQLQKGGYQRHTLLFSTYYLVQQLHEKKIIKPGDITNNIIEMNSHKFLEELFNQHTANQIEDHEKIKIKESKTKKAIPMFELFAQYINFKQSFFILIAPIIKSLESNPTIGQIQQCEELMNRLSSALLKNESLQQDDLLLFLYTIIHRGISNSLKVKVNNEKQERDYGAKIKDVFVRTKNEYKEMTYKVEMQWKKSHQMMDDKKTMEVCGRVIGSFGLQCLKKALKDKILTHIGKSDNNNDNDEQQQIDTTEEFKAKLDPFVGILIEALKTYHQPIVVTTLHVIGQIINLGLPSFKDNMKKFLNRLFKLFDQTNSGDTDFLNSLFKCTAELIKTYATYQDLTQPQVKMLISIIKANINSYSTQNNVFQCLRAIVYRKFMSSDLYDLIENVQEMMITNISKPIRQICSQIFLNFLLEYPLEESRIEQHINHLLKNLGYFDSESRLQVLEVIQTLCEKFPREVIDQYGELIFFTMILRSVNETHTKCRDKVASVLKKIIQKVSQNKSKTLFNTVLQMQSQDQNKNQIIQQAKLLVLGLFIESYQNLKQNDIQKIVDQCMHTIQEHALKIIENQNNEDDQLQDDNDDDIKNPEIKKFLQNIDLIDDKKDKIIIDFEEEKDKEEWSPLYYALTNIEKILINKQKIQIKDLIQNLILIGIKHNVFWIRLIIQRIFGLLFQNHSEKPQIDTIQAFGLQDDKDIVNMMYQLTNLFKYRQLNDDLGNQLIKNLIYLQKTILSQERFSKNISISKFFNKCSFIGRKMMLNIQSAKDKLQYILQFFLVSISLFEGISNEEKDNKIVRQAIEPILNLVYRVYTDDQYQDTKAKELSFEIVEYFSQNIDKSHFINVYNDVKIGINKKRQERKKQQKLLMASAEGAKIKDKKRAKKNEKKKQMKQQKRLHFELRKN